MIIFEFDNDLLIMAIKDLNNKKAGDKLYAKEWNTVMNEILAHFHNKRIHQDMIITSDDELVYTDENNVRHQYILQKSSGITYGELEITSVNGISLTNNTYIQSDISSDVNNLSFQISYQREVFEDNVHKEWQRSGARIIVLGVPEGIELISSEEDGFTIRMSNNQETTVKQYEFEVKVSMAETLDEEDQDNTKVFTVRLTQLGLTNPSLIYGQIPIINNSELQSLVVNNEYPDFIERNSQDISKMNTELDENFDGNIVLDETNSAAAFCFLIKDNTKKLYWVDSQNAHSEITEYSYYNAADHPNYVGIFRYLDNDYKIYVLPRPIQNQITMRVYISDDVKE